MSEPTAAPKVALIVGAGPGLGGTLCRRFAREGWTFETDLRPWVESW